MKKIISNRKYKKALQLYEILKRAKKGDDKHKFKLIVINRIVNYERKSWEINYEIY